MAGRWDENVVFVGLGAEGLTKGAETGMVVFGLPWMMGDVSDSYKSG